MLKRVSVAHVLLECYHYNTVRQEMLQRLFFALGFITDRPRPYWALSFHNIHTI